MNFKPIHSLIVLAAAIAIPQAAFGKVSEQTLKNLNTAFQGESNACNRYAAFAKKADEEGNAQVAKLFRATSAAEAIHRDTHKAAIVELGGTAGNFKLDEVTPGTTAENLKGAIKGEIYERDTMYPGFLATAKSDDAKAAIRSFQFAVTAEKGHAILYQKALDTLGNNASADYYVCQVCGLTLTALPAKRCPSCRQSPDKYKKIS